MKKTLCFLMLAAGLCQCQAVVAAPPNPNSEQETTPAWTSLEEFLPNEGDQPLVWPEVKAEMRPGAIWWWPASAVSKQDLTWNMQLYRTAGWGNLGIVGIYGVQGEEDRTIDLFSQKWFEMYNHTIAEANRLGMNIDLTPGGGWRWGGPHVTRPFAEQSFAVEENKIIAKPINDKVKRAGKGGVGLTINPYSEAAVAFHLDWFERLLTANGGKGPRAFYYDSFENTGNWCPEFLDEFQIRRGYRLEDHPEALSGQANTEVSRRVVADYRETLSELLIDRVEQIAMWVQQYGSRLRMQAHGAPANLLDMYAAAGIPETEVFGASKFEIAGFRRDPRWIRADQQSDLVNQFASSAAHVAGRPLVTAESFTWLRNHYHTSLAQLKAESDKLLLNGINSIYYHGACFSPEVTAWPGWLFYASTQANPRNSIFRDVPALNAYITRCQSVLQSGRPYNDVLLYWPVYDLWMDGGTGDQRYTVHHPDWIEKTSCGQAGRWMSQHGYTFDFVSDEQLQGTKVQNGLLKTVGGSQYRTVLIPNAKTMSIKTANQLVELARAGATILVWKEMPGEVPGWFEYEKRQQQLNVLFKQVSPINDETTAVGNGKFVVNDELGKLLDATDVIREPMVDAGLKFIRRTSPGEVSYFIANHTSKPIDRWVAVASPCKSAVLMNPMTAATGVAPLRSQNGQSEVWLQMQSGETRLLRAYDDVAMKGAAWAVKKPAGNAVQVTGPWDVQFIEGGPAMPANSVLSELHSWTEIADPDAKRFAGAARYTTTIEMPRFPQGSKPDGWLLNLGNVHESARVWLNGQPIGVVVAHPFQIDLGRHIKSGNNTLAIEVTNLSANRIRDLDRRGVDWKKFHDINFVDHLYKPFDASSWDLEPSGLLGPVQLIPYRYIDGS